MFSTLPSASDDAGTELAGWVWQAARSQRPRDYSLLDLSVRRGLPADEIAEATEMSHSGIYAILGRLRGFFEETFTSTLLYYRGREACPELSKIAGQGTLGPAVRRDIARHVETCGACRQSRRKYPSPADLLAAFTLIPVPDSLREAVASAAPTRDDVAAEAGQEAEGAGRSTLQAALPLAGAAGVISGAIAAASPEEAEPELAIDADTAPRDELVDEQEALSEAAGLPEATEEDIEDAGALTEEPGERQEE